ncbi:MAG: group 1 truncated hemoglobin [Oligoflexia bacterium]|nr:group 1 truncated hemoglobin [Oligoflexia bacterium]
MGKMIHLARPELKALYSRLGGEAALQRILEDFYRKMAADPMIGFFFHGQDLERIARAQKTFLMRAMGATSSYSGKAPAQAHDALPPILPGHFDRRLRILEETLRAHGLAAEDIRIWINFENAFRDGIVSEDH